MNEEYIIYPQQANSLAITKLCYIDDKIYFEKAKYRHLEELFKAEKGNDNLVIGRGRFFFYVLTPDTKFNL